jgi:hypothetical protein
MAASKPCSICTHDRRHQIEIGLVHRVPLRALAVRFQCSPDALHRHRHRHLTPQMAAAILVAQRSSASAVELETLQRNEAEGLLAQLVSQRARLQQQSDLALDLGNASAAVACERAITSNLELVAKLLGQLVQRHEVTHANILISSDYLNLRSAIVRALQPFPDAARAVGEALHRLEADAAQAIATKAMRPPMIEAEAVAS